MRRLLLVGLVLTAFAGPAWSAGATPPGRAAASKLITNPDWAALPSGDDVARFYPEHAMRNGIGGRAVIVCSITVDGDLTDCEVESESPPGEDFGAAAVRMASIFKMKPKTLDGAPAAGGRVRIPVRFEAPPPGDSVPIMLDKPTGPPPPLPPTTGRFVFAGVGHTEGQETGPILFYLRIPDDAAGDSRPAWMLVVFPPIEDARMYWAMLQTFDCAGRRFTLKRVQIFVGGVQVSWTDELKADWAPVDGDPMMAAGLDLACGKTAPTPALPTVEAVQADAAKRFATLPAK